MRVGLVVSGVLAVVLMVGACGDDDEFEPDSEPETDGGGLLEDAGSLSGLQVINPLCGAGDGGEADGCDDCVEANCVTHFSQCFGSSWQSELGGVCTTFGQCVMDCDCGDHACFNVCTDQLQSSPGDPCSSCVTSLLECELAHCENECADEGGADAGEEGGSGGPTDAGGDGRP